MKKLLPILILTLFLFGCTHNGGSAIQEKASKPVPTVQQPAKFTIADMFPFKKNLQLNYCSSAGASSNSILYVDSVKNNRMQFRLVDSDSSVGYVVEDKNGELRIITTRDSFYYHDDLTNLQNANPEIMLKEPLIKGTAWTLPNGGKRYISNDNVQITTAAGKYIAIEITTENEKGKILDYYVPNVGLVEKIISDSKSTVISSLEAITNDGSSSETVKFYYPNIEKDTIMYFQRQLHYKTDDQSKKFFEKYFKESPSNTFGRLISINTKINKLALNIDEKKVYVDFSKEFIKDMNLSSAEEALTLKCITDTLCDYFNVDKLLLTVDGSPYESKNIIMKPNELLYSDIANIVEIK